MPDKKPQPNTSIKPSNGKMNEDRGLPPVKDSVPMPKVKPIKDKK